MNEHEVDLALIIAKRVLLRALINHAGQNSVNLHFHTLRSLIGASNNPLLLDNLVIVSQSKSGKSYFAKKKQSPKPLETLWLLPQPGGSPILGITETREGYDFVKLDDFKASLKRTASLLEHNANKSSP